MCICKHLISWIIELAYYCVQLQYKHWILHFLSSSVSHCFNFSLTLSTQYPGAHLFFSLPFSLVWIHFLLPFTFLLILFCLQYFKNFISIFLEISVKLGFENFWQPRESLFAPVSVKNCRLEGFWLSDLISTSTIMKKCASRFIEQKS